MPYCEPYHIYHLPEDITNGVLSFCVCGNYHHYGENVACVNSAATPQDETCPTCLIRHYGEICPEQAEECDECDSVHSLREGCLPWCDQCDEHVGHDHDCPYIYCDACGEYVYDPYREHDCGGYNCCESPQLQFAIRNDGFDPLPNDTRASFSLPAGTITTAGLTAMRRYLCNAGHYNLSQELDRIGDQWQAKAGNYPKRLSRFAYQEHHEKLTPETMSQVGCIARDHSGAVAVEIEVTRDLNQSAEYFYHEDSCYWGGYSESRCALKTNGAFGIRSFECGRLSGRAWVMPLKLALAEPGYSDRMSLVPTFDTMSPDAFVVFNGYGDLGGYAPARIMAHMAGWTYRKVAFSCDPAYINAGGFLVAPEDIAEPYTDGSLHLTVHQHSDLYESEMSHA